MHMVGKTTQATQVQDILKELFVHARYASADNFLIDFNFMFQVFPSLDFRPTLMLAEFKSSQTMVDPSLAPAFYHIDPNLLRQLRNRIIECNFRHDVILKTSVYVQRNRK